MDTKQLTEPARVKALIAELDWCVANGHAGPRTAQAIETARAALAALSSDVAPMAYMNPTNGCVISADSKDRSVRTGLQPLLADDYSNYTVPLYAAPVAAQAPEQVGNNALVLTGAQLLEALDFIAPDRATDPEQMEATVAIEYGKGHGGEAMYVWCAEYPEEGSFVLDGAIPVPQAPVADGARAEPVSDGWAAFTDEEIAAFEGLDAAQAKFYFDRHNADGRTHRQMAEALLSLRASTTQAAQQPARASEAGEAAAFDDDALIALAKKAVIPDYWERQNAYLFPMYEAEFLTAIRALAAPAQQAVTLTDVE